MLIRTKVAAVALAAATAGGGAAVYSHFHHGHCVSSVARSAPAGPNHGSTVSQAASHGCSK